MAAIKDLREALEVYDTLCSALDTNDLPYEKLEDDFVIKCSVQGEDLPIQIYFQVDAERHIVRLSSLVPVSVPEEKRLDLAVAISAVNNCLVDGNFDYDVTGGSIHFRMTHSYLESVIGQERFLYMLTCSADTIDDFNDKFFMLAKNMISLGQFLDMFKD